MTELIFKDDVYAIVGAAMEVHRVLGHGFLESVYQEALEIGSRIRELPYEGQKVLQIHYKEYLLKIRVYCRFGLLQPDYCRTQSIGYINHKRRRSTIELLESNQFQSRLAHQFWLT